MIRNVRRATAPVLVLTCLPSSRPSAAQEAPERSAYSLSFELRPVTEDADESDLTARDIRHRANLALKLYDPT
jgi:hypothetical protein